MPRLLTILKYVPAALCGLLVVAWVVTQFFGLYWKADIQSCRFGINANCGTLFLSLGGDASPSLFIRVNSEPFNWSKRPDYYESLICYTQRSSNGEIAYRLLIVPMMGLATLLLPLAIGPFIRFRFPLWSYFAWTALVAVELAYYLR